MTKSPRRHNRRSVRAAAPPVLSFRCSSNMSSSNLQDRPIPKQRLRPWLERLLNNHGSCPGVEWVNRKEQVFQIAWRHASSQGFQENKHSDIFKRWAQNTGKRIDHTKNKSNFRCALRSLKDCVELTACGDKRGEGARRTYQFIDESHPDYDKKRRKQSTARIKQEVVRPVRDDAPVTRSRKRKRGAEASSDATDNSHVQDIHEALNEAPESKLDPGTVAAEGHPSEKLVVHNVPESGNLLVAASPEMERFLSICPDAVVVDVESNQGSGQACGSSGEACSQASGSSGQVCVQGAGFGDQASGSSDQAFGSTDQAFGPSGQTFGSTGQASGSSGQAFGSSGQASGSDGQACGQAALSSDQVLYSNGAYTSDMYTAKRSEDGTLCITLTTSLVTKAEGSEDGKYMKDLEENHRSVGCSVQSPEGSSKLPNFKVLGFPEYQSVGSYTCQNLTSGGQVRVLGPDVKIPPITEIILPYHTTSPVQTEQGTSQELTRGPLHELSEVVHEVGPQDDASSFIRFLDLLQSKGSSEYSAENNKAITQSCAESQPELAMTMTHFPATEALTEASNVLLYDDPMMPNGKTVLVEFVEQMSLPLFVDPDDIFTVKTV